MLLLLVLASLPSAAVAHTHGMPPRHVLEDPPADMPHLPELFKTVRGDVSNVTANVSFGAVPDWLSVTKYNNGFGQYEGVGFRFNYLFDVLAYVVKWRVHDGRPPCRTAPHGKTAIFSNTPTVQPGLGCCVWDNGHNNYVLRTQ